MKILGDDENLNILHKVQLITLIVIIFSISILMYVDSAYAEPVAPTISDKQKQMIREYCETGIRHPDMIGIPQCVKNECDPDMYGNFYCYEEENGQKINLENAIKYFGNTERVREVYIGGGPIDLDPDLSPSYAYDYANRLIYLTIIPLAGLFVGISALFLVPYFILKRKKIPSKPYLALILSGILLYFALSSFQPLNHGAIVPELLYPDQTKMELIGALIFLFWIPIFCFIIAGILLYRSSIIRKLIKK